MEVASSRPDHLPILSAAKTSKLSLLVKSLLVAERPMPATLHRLSASVMPAISKLTTLRVESL